MITPRQIRAARGLLGWEAIDLGKRTDLNPKTITNIEEGRTKPQADSIERIAKALTDAGVDFTPNEGVRIKPSHVEIFEGLERFADFNDFFYEAVRKHGGDICLSVTDERFFAKYMPNTIEHYARMQTLFDTGVFKNFRILANQSNFATKYNYNTYRRQRETSLSPAAFYTFADCLALISFVHPNPPFVVVIRSAPLASSYTLAFDAAWATADEAPPPRVAPP
jgi:transcriptional regulator with XRE-family HTH domain